MIGEPHIQVPMERVEAFCRRWGVREFSLFGSVLRDDFGPESDIDVLVTFDETSEVSLMEWGPMLDELRGIFGRSVDLVEKAAIKNPLRRRYILEGSRVLYAA